VGNLEGKEVRFGVANSALFATVTTDTSCGAVNSMHDSFTPLGGNGSVDQPHAERGDLRRSGRGDVWNAGLRHSFRLYCRIDGGAHAGISGKKIEAYDVKMAMLVMLIFPLVILVFTAISVLYSFGTSSMANAGPHGFTEVLYAFTSSVANNGSAFGGT
jgi:potassium-transporting ATPase potassium-binding subunit